MTDHYLLCQCSECLNGEAPLCAAESEPEPQESPVERAARYRREALALREEAHRLCAMAYTLEGRGRRSRELTRWSPRVRALLAAKSAELDALERRTA